MSHPLDGLDPMYCDDISDIIWAYTLDANGDELTPENYANMKSDLLDYFKELEDDGHARRGLGFEFVRFLDKTFGSLVKLHNKAVNDPSQIIP